MVHMKSGVIVFVLCVCVAAPTYAGAHGAGASWEASSGPYVVDIGYDTQNFDTESSIRFDFAVWADGTKTVSADFGQVWVRVVGKTDTQLAVGLIRQSVGPTTLLYRFQVPGEYSFNASFRDAEGKEIAAAVFPFTVVGGKGTTANDIPYLPLAAGFIVGCAVVYALKGFLKLDKTSHVPD